MLTMPFVIATTLSRVCSIPPSRHRSRTCRVREDVVRRVASVSLACGIITCSSESVADPRSRPPPDWAQSPVELTTVSSAALMGAALQALGPDGRFMQASVPFDPMLPTLSQQEAEGAIAEYLRTFGPSDAFFLSQSRGEPINVAALTACGPALYAESSLSPPPDSLIYHFRVYLGPYWVQYLCEAGVEKVIVSVGAYAKSLAGLNFDSAASFSLDALLSVSFRTFGLPVGVRPPIHPEEAAARVAALTGRRVSEIPRLVMPRTPGSQNSSMWAVELDSSTTVKGVTSGAVRARQVLLYGMYLPRLQVVVWDSTDPDPGPLLTTGQVLAQDGSQRDFPMSLARRPLPSFLHHMEAVARP